MKIRIEINTEGLKLLAIAAIRGKFDIDIDEKDISIEVRSQQNYRQREWEHGEFRAILEKDI